MSEVVSQAFDGSLYWNYISDCVSHLGGGRTDHDFRLSLLTLYELTSRISVRGNFSIAYVLIDCFAESFQDLCWSWFFHPDKRLFMEQATETIIA